jgi:hypothetical protein
MSTSYSSNRAVISSQQDVKQWQGSHAVVNVQKEHLPLLHAERTRRKGVGKNLRAPSHLDVEMSQHVKRMALKL